MAADVKLSSTRVFTDRSARWAVRCRPLPPIVAESILRSLRSRCSEEEESSAEADQEDECANHGGGALANDERQHYPDQFRNQESPED